MKRIVQVLVGTQQFDFSCQFSEYIARESMMIRRAGASCILLATLSTVFLMAAALSLLVRLWALSVLRISGSFTSEIIALRTGRKNRFDEVCQRAQLIESRHKHVNIGLEGLPLQAPSVHLGAQLDMHKFFEIAPFEGVFDEVYERFEISS